MQDDLIQINRGIMAEQFVGQELIAYQDPDQHSQLFYWQREKQRSDAEIDYLFTEKQSILPIEVKAGKHGRLKSLQQFMKEKHSAFGIRISQHPLSFKNNILSVPFYLIWHLSTLVKDVLSKRR